MQRIIRSMEDRYLLPLLELVEDVFAQWDSPEEGMVDHSLYDALHEG